MRVCALAAELGRDDTGQPQLVDGALDLGGDLLGQNHITPGHTELAAKLHGIHVQLGRKKTRHACRSIGPNRVPADTVAVLLGLLGAVDGDEISRSLRIARNRVPLQTLGQHPPIHIQNPPPLSLDGVRNRAAFSRSLGHGPTVEQLDISQLAKGRQRDNHQDQAHHQRPAVERTTPRDGRTRSAAHC